jgi:hypothetical protein
MLRRLVIAGLASVLAAPLSATPPASATVLFTCDGVGDSYSYANFLSQGLSHTQAYQDLYGYIGMRQCSNGLAGAGDIYFGGNTTALVTTYPPRPLGCPVAWGGAGPDYPDRTPILFGPDPPRKGYSALYIVWGGVGTKSRGIAKFKQGAAGDQWRMVMVINSGEYAPPPGQKTKIKGPVNFAPDPESSYTCADDSDPLERILFSSAGTLIVSQK